MENPVIGPAITAPPDATTPAGNPADIDAAPPVSNNGRVGAQSLVAIIARSDVNAVQRCEAVWAMQLQTGMTARELARMAGVAESTVSRLQTVGLLPEADKQRVREGTLGLAAAYRLARGQAGAITGRARKKRRACVTIKLTVSAGVTLVMKRSVSALDAVADALVGLASRLREAHVQGARSPQFLVNTVCP